ncbi:lamin tail domain-containing protein [Bythopirellula polymerisocia]|uniref:LTD domain-containing protein n=1 Tax=Bythopirellula polymerisocia TaxID=2528003 RepID=A0A5C6CPV2_9BACT|nr:lamin tail domain-containing protein [Bythopirellula polymerisocia]TWU26075.1 hypothetical protein Pla144_32920 [Bythopirellula polymerisocia]
MCVISSARALIPFMLPSIQLVVFLLTCFSTRLAVAEVIISEIMYDPQGSDTNKEWVELFNTGSSAVDLGGWTLEDIQDGSVSSVIQSGVVLLPSQALVLTGDSALFDVNWGLGINRLQLSSFPTLANTPSPTNEIIAIRDHLGIVRDQVNYDDEFGWPDLVGSDGESIFLRPNALSASQNDDGTNWLPSMTGLYGAFFTSMGGLGENHGSPGYVERQIQEPFVPSPDAAWSMVIFPDTQNYVKNASQVPILSEMTQWVRDNRESWGIQLVLQEGDIVNNNDTVTPNSGDQDSSQQWQHAKDAFSLLDGQVPYIFATGNHDHGFLNTENRDTEFNTYFSSSDNPLVDPTQGGILKGVKDPGELQNAYYEFTAPDGREILVVSLEWAPRQQTVAWANQIVSQSKYEEHTTILLTHGYTDQDDTRWQIDPATYPAVTDGNDGEDLWNELVKLHGNFEFVFSGHVGGDGLGYLTSNGVEGNLVHQILFNTQFEANGGSGWIRVLEFLDDGHTVRVRTYSPHHDLQKTDLANAFLMDISPIPIFTADFDGDGDVDAADLVKWQEAYGLTSLADADQDGDSDGADFLEWQRQFGSGTPGTESLRTVPEPNSILLIIIVGFFQSWYFRCVQQLTCPGIAIISDHLVTNRR